MNAMTKTVSLSLLWMASAIVGVEASAAGVDPDVAAIHAVDQTWLKAHNDGDADTIAALYDEKAILLPPGAQAAHGRAAIRTFFVSDVAETKKAGVSIHFGPNPDGGVHGDMGWASGTYSVTDTSGKVVDTGKYLSVSKKENGKWLYVRDTWNSDVTAPSEAPPKNKLSDEVRRGELSRRRCRFLRQPVQDNCDNAVRRDRHTTASSACA